MKLLSKSYCLKHYKLQYYTVTKPEYAELLIAQALMCGAYWYKQLYSNKWEVPVHRMHIRRTPSIGTHMPVIEVLTKCGDLVNVSFEHYNRMLEQAHEKSNT